MGMKRILMIVLLIGLGSAPLAGRAEEELFDTKAAVQHLERGIALLNAKHYDAAIAEFDESAEISPEAEAYYFLGYAYYLKARTKDGESRNLSRENFERAYEIDPNFTPRHATPAEAAPAHGKKTLEQGATGAPSAPEQPVPSSPASAPAVTNAAAPAATPAQPAP